MTTRPGRGRVQFLLLATLFFAPLLAANVLYFFMPDRIPSRTTNYGELVQPVRRLEDDSWQRADGTPAGIEVWRGKWTLLHVTGESCDAPCRERLVLTRQTRAALNEKRVRVRRILLAQPEAAAALALALGPEQPDLLVLADAAPASGLAELFRKAAPGTVFLFDPLGNLLMTYPPGRPQQDEFKGLKKDLSKLLRVSQIG